MQQVAERLKLKRLKPVTRPCANCQSAYPHTFWGSRCPSCKSINWKYQSYVIPVAIMLGAILVASLGIAILSKWWTGHQPQMTFINHISTAYHMHLILIQTLKKLFIYNWSSFTSLQWMTALFNTTLRQRDWTSSDCRSRLMEVAAIFAGLLVGAFIYKKLGVNKR